MSALLTELAVPFSYDYMLKAMWVSALVGAVCAFLSAYLMLKGWSLMGDALAHAIVPGVAAAYIIGAPFAAGAFLAGLLAALGMGFVKQHTRLREDAVIGLVFTAFFALGLLMASIWPTSVSIQTIVLGNILAISDEDATQVVIIAAISLVVLLLIWKDLMVTFFDEGHARSIGINTRLLKIVFFTLLSACTVAALQTVGACLVIAMVVTPGATAYLLTDRFRVHVAEIAVWALFYCWAGCLPDAESAFYFSGATYTTVGYGDLVLAKPWRMLAPLEGLTGILMCGLSASLFFALVSRIYASRVDAKRK
jgi:manganese/iron transport system permease protein